MRKIKTEGTLSETAYSIIKNAIIRLELKPGAALFEDSLSESLGISRTPIRTALQRLSYEGLVDIKQGKGNYVTKLSSNFFLDVYELRESMEVLSVKLATMNRTSNDLKRMREILKKQSAIYDKPKFDHIKFLDLDYEFHIAISIATKNEMLIKHIAYINQTFARYLYFAKFDSRVSTVLEDHLKILESIDKQDIEWSKLVMKDHLLGVKKCIVNELLDMGY